jgi:hypothetical protein
MNDSCYNIRKRSTYGGSSTSTNMLSSEISNMINNNLSRLPIRPDSKEIIFADQSKVKSARPTIKQGNFFNKEKSIDVGNSNTKTIKSNGPGAVPAKNKMWADEVLIQ